MENNVFIFTFCFGPKILGSNIFSFSIIYEFAHLISRMLNVGGMCVIPQKYFFYIVSYFVYNMGFLVSV